MPPVKHDYDSSLGQAAEELARRWHTCDVMGVGSNGPLGAAAADLDGWGAEQITFFLVRHTLPAVVATLWPAVACCLQAADEVYTVCILTLHSAPWASHGPRRKQSVILQAWAPCLSWCARATVTAAYVDILRRYHCRTSC